MRQSFEAIIKSDRITYIDIPFNASQVFNKKGKIQVKGEINGHPYRKPLLSRGGGVYILTLNKAYLKTVNIKEGDKVFISMDLDDNLLHANLDPKNHEDIIKYHESIKQKKELGETFNVLEAIFTRRSIRKFTGEVIKDTELETIIKAGCYAPSAENKQPWHYLIVRDKATLENTSKSHARAKMITQAGCGIIVCGDKEKQPQIGFLIEDCSAAIENMLLAAHGLGLGAVWCGLYPATQLMRPIKNLFKLPSQILPIGLVVIGYINESKDIVYRYDESKVHFERW